MSPLTCLEVAEVGRSKLRTLRIVWSWELPDVDQLPRPSVTRERGPALEAPTRADCMDHPRQLHGNLIRLHFRRNIVGSKGAAESLTRP